MQIKINSLIIVTCFMKDIFPYKIKILTMDSYMCVVRYGCVSNEMLLYEISQICMIYIIRTNVLREKILMEFFLLNLLVFTEMR